MKQVLAEVLKEIKPSKEEERIVKDKISKVISKIQKSLPKYPVILGGSGEKGTWLKNAHDADIFIKFPKEYTGKSISDILEKALKRNFKDLSRLHGSRDYFQTKQEGFIFEIVPIIDIKKADEAPNITDVSPLHAKWVLKHKKYADEIRLTKQFCKAAKVYGAESYINGFSGYICEILTIYYRGFEPLVKAIAKWKEKVIIDIEGYHKGKNMLMEIDKSKTHGPLIIIDPVQASRNAAAAVSKEKFDQLIDYSKKFVKKPSKDFFQIKNIDVSKLKKQSNDDLLVLIEANTDSGKDDVVGCKLLKSFEFIKKELLKNEFTVKFADWEWEDIAKFYFIIDKAPLSVTKTIQGPPVKIKKGSQDFKAKHKEVFEKDGFLYAIEKRRFTDALSFISVLIHDPYVNEKLASISVKKL